MQHVSLKKMVRGLRASIEGKFGLAAVQVCFPPGLWKSRSLTYLAQGGMASMCRIYIKILTTLSTQVGSEFAVSTVEQQFQIKALRTLNACLTALTVDAPGKFEGPWPSCYLFSTQSVTRLPRQWSPRGKLFDEQYLIGGRHR